MTKEEVARVCPLDVIPHQWRELVHYWFSEKAQIYFNIGRAARASQTVPHTSSSMSYARRRAEFMDDNGRKPGKVEFYKITHTHRDGSFVRKEARDIVDRATTLISERVRESSSSDAISHVEAQVLAELLGLERYGRVRDYGVGVTPTQLSAVGMYTRNAGEGSSNAEVSRLRTTIEDMKDRHQAELAELKQNQQSLLSQLEHISSMLQRFLPPQISNTSTARRDDDGTESGP
ncbi:uncharacterized protein LOC103717144 [Phoenix dactylifera]|uniref:Uncharacterized protein LOC103717144 n=1 Tax=Phoenix dactylifera TaxID=42345 RepID=A0A8B9ALC6_PHODC|nr:uncharacterized protein LOC103717144 [Phoenix dactylifera]XP_038986482.1 uncharacterized protein LOC103717144 [Phoenix dactylifera]